MSRVLVVDDSETILLLMRKRLQLAGYEVVAAPDAEQGLELVQEERPDVILLDAMLPRLSGLQMLRRLRGEGDQTPVIMVSAHRDSAEMSEARASGASRALTKPIDWDELLRELAAVIEEESG